MKTKPRDPLRPRFTAAAKITVQITNSIKRAESWTGTGFVLNRNGIILTAFHLIGDAKKVWVRRYRTHRDSWRLFSRKRKYLADVIFTDKRIDVAVLKLRKPPPGLSVAVLGDSSRLAVGVPLFRIGEDENEQHFSAGYVFCQSSHKRMKMYQISMSASRGGSGGPVTDGKDKIVGIFVFCQHDNDSTPDYAEFVPINTIKRRVLRDPKVREAMRPPPATPAGTIIP